jgi:CBS domain-containing protein
MKKISELLTGRDVVTVRADATVLEAVQIMGASQVGAVMILDENRAPVGIFTERDLMVRVVLAELDPAVALVEEHMTREPFYVSPERTLSDVSHEVQKRHIRHVPVVRGGEVIGLLSVRDLLRELLQIKLEEVQALKSYIQGEGESAAS